MAINDYFMTFYVSQVLFLNLQDHTHVYKIYVSYVGENGFVAKQWNYEIVMDVTLMTWVIFSLEIGARHDSLQVWFLYMSFQIIPLDAPTDVYPDHTSDDTENISGH